MKKYLPLFLILGLSFAAAAAWQLRAGSWQWMAVMPSFMGLFLLSLSQFKLFNLPAFVTGFRKYDLLAGPVPAYGYVYPFLELGLALLYLSGRAPRVAYIVTIVLMLFGLLGILRSVARKQQLQCACMGTVLNVPLSTVSICENAGMSLMAAIMLGLGA